MNEGRPGGRSVRFTLLTRDVAPHLVDRYSERKEALPTEVALAHEEIIETAALENTATQHSMPSPVRYEPSDLPLQQA